MSHPCAVAPDADFQQLQQRFAGTIRDPDGVATPEDVPERRMAVYRELIFNNVSALLAGGFPILHSVSGERRWKGLIRDFLRDHRCHTPLFPQVAREFLDYLEKARGERAEDPSFLRELAHYEWLEVELGLSEEEIPETTESAITDPLERAFRLSPLARLVGYRFPVHRIGEGFVPDAPGETPSWLLVYRDRRDEVGFLEANPVTARLIRLLAEPPESTARTLLQQIADELRHPRPEMVIEGGRALIDELIRRDIVL